MSETINLDFIGATLRSIQAEQRSIRGENQLIRSALNEAITLLMQRIGNFEEYVDTRLDRHRMHVDQRLDTAQSHLDQRLDAERSVPRPAAGRAPVAPRSTARRARCPDCSPGGFVAVEPVIRAARRPSSPRMRLPPHLHEPLGVHRGVALRRREPGMAEQFLDRA